MKGIFIYHYYKVSWSPTHESWVIWRNDKWYKNVYSLYEGIEDVGCYYSMDEEYRQSTCTECVLNDTCEFAWDGYNTHGDCLAEK